MPIEPPTTLLVMSVTSNSKLAGLLEWLENNSFWNSELLEVCESPIGGVGVFWKLGPEPDEENDNLLLRIPKLAVLSPKNSFLYPLIVDYEPDEPTVDLTFGMHAIVITFIYEYSMGDQSPWFQYLDSFEVETGDSGIPFCLWSKQDTACLFNSEVDLLNMLDLAELIVFMMECVRFAHLNARYVAIPDVLNIDPDTDWEDITAKHNDKLIQFGRYVQAVISRAFTVDKYLGLSLVPGADLFNHLSPIVTDGVVMDQENVHFECDDGADLCEECGEIGCAHLEEDEEDNEEEEEIQEGIEEEIEVYGSEGEEEGEQENGGEDEEEEGDGNVTLEFLMESDIELDASSESLASEDESDSETESMDEEEAERPEKTSITMEDIEELEMSDADTEQDEEEVSTLSLSEGEEDDQEANENEDNDNEKDNENEEAKGDVANDDLVRELSDSSKCCDIVLTSLPSKEHNYELFNTYGNDLANAYLLQRYGFVSPDNPNTSLLLSVQMFSYLKKEKMNKKKRVQLDTKLEWYEEVGFEVVNELVLAALSNQGESGEGEEKSDDDDDDSHDHNDSHDHDDSHDHESIETPESWQLSPRISYDGSPTEQTVALVRLLLLPFKVFFYKLAVASSNRKLIKRVSHYLLEGDVTDNEKMVLATWVKGRLARYREFKGKGERAELARELIGQEKKVLHRALEVLET